MATGPKLANSPLELLTNDGSHEPPVINQVWGPVICGSLGFISVVMTNWTLRRPVMSGIQSHVVITAIGVKFGTWLDTYRENYLAQRDAVYRHYIQLHPEDFPDFARKKYGEVLESWVPIR